MKSNEPVRPQTQYIERNGLLPGEDFPGEFKKTGIDSSSGIVRNFRPNYDLKKPYLKNDS